MKLFDNKKVLSIDFGAHEIKVVEGKFSKRGVTIDKQFSILVPEKLYLDGQIQSMENLQELLKEGMKEHNIGSESVIAVINSSKIITREISIPKVSNEQIDAILKFQVGDYIPIHPDDYIVKYVSTGSIFEEGAEKITLLLIAIPKSIVESHFNLLKNIGLKPIILDYQGNACNKLIDFNDKINERNSIINKTIAVIDLGHDSTKLTITKNGINEVSRILESSGKKLMQDLGIVLNTDNAGIIKELKDIKNVNNELREGNLNYDRDYHVNEFLKDLFDKIEMIFRYYRTNELGNNIDLCVLQGGLSHLDGIDKSFFNKFNTPTIIIESLDKIKFEDDLSKYSNAIGGLIRLSEV